MREYRVWTKEEEQCLRLGAAKYGSGAWELIRTDPDFSEALKHRTGVQLKDKWRNLVKFNHLTTEELRCGRVGGVSTRAGLRRGKRTPITDASEDTEHPETLGTRSQAITRSKSRRGADSRTVDAPSPTAAKDLQLLVTNLHRLREAATPSASMSADAGLDGLGDSNDSTESLSQSILDCVLDLVHTAIDSGSPLTVPSAIVEACPEELRTLLLPIMPDSDYELHRGPSVAHNTDSKVPQLHQPKGQKLHLSGPEAITTGGTPHTSPEVRNFHTFFNTLPAAGPSREQSEPLLTHKAATVLGQKRSLPSEQKATTAVDFPPSKKIAGFPEEESPGSSFLAATDLQAPLSSSDLLERLDQDCVQLLPEGADSASQSEDDALPEEALLSELYMDCVRQTKSNAPKPSLSNPASRSLQNAAPTRLSGPQVAIDPSDFMHGNTQPLSMYESPTSQILEGSGTVLPSAQCMLNMSVPVQTGTDAANGTGSPGKPSLSPCTPSASGGSTAGFTAPFPCMGTWASIHGSPSANSLADTSSFDNLHGLHALRASFAPTSTDNLPGSIPSGNTSLRSSSELPEASGNFHFPTNSDALLGSAASTLLGFSPSAPMRAIHAPYPGMLTQTQTHPTFASGQGFDGMPMSLGLPPNSFEVASGGTCIASSHASAAGTPSDSPRADTLKELQNSLIFDKLASDSLHCVQYMADAEPYSGLCSLMGAHECHLNAFDDASRLCGPMFFDV